MSNVSRSTYQKVVEENKRLKADIEILVNATQHPDQYIEVFLKWRRHFKKQHQFNCFMKEAAINYLEQHPELKIS